MATIIINEDSKQAKAIIAMLKAFDFVKFVSEKKDKEEKSPYNPEFVAKIREAEEDIKAGRVIEVKDVKKWLASLG